MLLCYKIKHNQFVSIKCLLGLFFFHPQDFYLIIHASSWYIEQILYIGLMRWNLILCTLSKAHAGTLLGIKHHLHPDKEQCDNSTHCILVEVQPAPDLSIGNKQRIQTGINEHGDSSAQRKWPHICKHSYIKTKVYSQGFTEMFTLTVELLRTFLVLMVISLPTVAAGIRTSCLFLYLIPKRLEIFFSIKLTISSSSEG